MLSKRKPASRRVSLYAIYIYYRDSLGETIPIKPNQIYLIAEDLMKAIAKLIGIVLIVVCGYALVTTHHQMPFIQIAGCVFGFALAIL